MTKLEFIHALNERLSALPREEAQERIGFYTEAIEDRMEEGLPEEEAVAAVGAPGEIAESILAELRPVQTPRKERKGKRSAGEITLLVLGAPLWLPLLIAAAAVLLSVYLVFWALVISFWAVFAAFAVCAVGGVLGGAVLAFGNGTAGLFLIGAGIFCAGASVFLLYGCNALSRGAVLLGAYPFRKLAAKAAERRAA